MRRGIPRILPEHQEKQEGLSPCSSQGLFARFPSPFHTRPPPSKLRTQVFHVPALLLRPLLLSCLTLPFCSVLHLQIYFYLIPRAPVFLVHNGYACTLHLCIEHHLEKGTKGSQMGEKTIRPIPWRCSMQSRSERPRTTRAGTRKSILSPSLHWSGARQIHATQRDNRTEQCLVSYAIERRLKYIRKIIVAARPTASHRKETPAERMTFLPAPLSPVSVLVSLCPAARIVLVRCVVLSHPL